MKLKDKKDHKLVTRRHFLGQGMTTAIGYSVVPSLASILQIRQAYGQVDNCLGAQAFEQKTPVIIIDLAGGAALSGSNIIVGGQEGQHSFLPDYERLGLPSGMHPNIAGMINNEMGIKFHSRSGILQGILQHTNSTVRSRCEGSVFCAISNDDTGNNPHSPLYWLNRAGAQGQIVQTAGTSGGTSGGRSKIPPTSFDPTAAPVQISRPEDCVELISLGRVHNLFNEDKAKKILQTIEYMSEAKLAQFSRRTLPEQVKMVLECSFSKSKIDQSVHNPDPRLSNEAVDPRLDTTVTATYDNLNDGRQRREASVAKMVLDGYIGAGTIEMGGYDYHGRTRSESDESDRLAGEAIGRILSLANRKEKDVVIYVFSDGGISTNRETRDASAENKFNFTNDDGQRASTFMLYYKHQGGRPQLYDSSGSFDTLKRQVGWFKESAHVEKNANVLSNNVTNLAKAVVLNYLAIHGEENRLSEIVGDNPFSSELDKYVIFGNNS